MLNKSAFVGFVGKGSSNETLGVVDHSQLVKTPFLSPCVDEGTWRTRGAVL